MTHPHPTALPERIADLDDEQAITVLAAVATRRGYHPDPTTAGQQDQHLREALTQPEITTTLTPTPTSQGDLARTALTHLATTDPDTATLVDRALQLPTSGERDPVLLFGIGALVLYAFHTDIDLRRDPDKGWSFHFHTTALSDSTIGKLLGQLLGSYLGPDK